MEPFILHSTPLKDFQDMIGEIVEEKLRQLRDEKPDKVNEEYLTRREVCERIRVSYATLHSYTKEGLLKSYKIGGRVLYRQDEVEQSLQTIQAKKYQHKRSGK
jgi:excisionase family DNA binding protein